MPVQGPVVRGAGGLWPTSRRISQGFRESYAKMAQLDPERATSGATSGLVLRDRNPDAPLPAEINRPARDLSHNASARAAERGTMKRPIRIAACLRLVSRTYRRVGRQLYEARIAWRTFYRLPCARASRARRCATSLEGACDEGRASR